MYVTFSISYLTNLWMSRPYSYIPDNPWTDAHGTADWRASASGLLNSNRSIPASSTELSPPLSPNVDTETNSTNTPHWLSFVVESTFQRKHSGNGARSSFIDLASPLRFPEAAAVIGNIAPLFDRDDTENGRLLNTISDREDLFTDTPDASDWNVEGTGRRVAYDDFTTIDWIHDFAKERSRQRLLKEKNGFYGQLAIMYDATQGPFIVLMTGIASGILAASIDITSEWLRDLKEGHCDTAFYLNKQFCCWGLDVPTNEMCDMWIPWSSAVHANPEWGSFLVQYTVYAGFAMILSGVASTLVVKFAPYAAGSGIPEVKTILGGFVIRKFLGVYTLVVKSIGLVLAAASGLSLGKEGPLVHLACCCGNILSRIFPKFRNNEGISLEVSYYFPYKTMWRSFFCAMIAAVSLQLMNPFRTGKLVLFQVSYDRDWHGFEMIFFALLGIVGGLYGAFFIRMNLMVTAFRKSSWLRRLPVQEVLIVTLATAVLGYLNRFMRVGGSELVAKLFRECESGDFQGVCNDDVIVKNIVLLLMAAVMKIVFSIATFGMHVPAGILMPSMAIGACVGRSLGMAVRLWQRNDPAFWLFAACKPDVPCITPGTYAMVGAAAALGGTTRITVSLVVIMFELTGALTYVLPTMVAGAYRTFVTQSKLRIWYHIIHSALRICL
ncbi:chloride channel [Jimgerdemannia flammicorona]|uniref:Chloride channel n=1 Tax=Jimgerdemannia flammicorona TaxID=994334 RepID=A0A433DKX0_9FUNG|nr:chloride channel [Jimgerdemannia flammicorona]